MLFRLIALFGLVGFFALTDVAYAYTPESEVSVSTLKLIGRGMAPRHSEGESLALACTTEICDSLRFVHFQSSNKAYFIGDPIPVLKEEIESHRKMAKKIKHYLKDRDQRKNPNWHAKGNRQGFVFGAFIFGSMVFAMVAPVALTMAYMTFIFSTKGFITVTAFFTLTYTPIGDRFLTHGSLDNTAKMNDQTGWNWSVEPRKVSNKKFNELVSQIRAGD